MQSDLDSSAPPQPVAKSNTSHRATLAGACILALGGCAVFPVRPESPWRTAVVGMVAVVVVACALILRSPASIRASAFIGTLFGCFAVGIHFGWPPAITTALVCVLPLGCLLIVGRRPSLGAAAPWLRRGSITPEIFWLGLVTVVLGGVALVVWALIVRPEPAEYLSGLQRLPLWLAILGTVAFALVNPIWEEMLFRGVLLTELASVWGTRAAVVLQAMLFGVAHSAGFPSGVAGMVMAMSWGFVLGVIRARSGGILMTYLVHVTANAVIGVLAVLILV